MKNSIKHDYISFYEDGKRYMQCKVCKYEYIEIGKETVAITCSSCVARKCLSLMPIEDFYPSLKRKTTGRPPGWHFMKQYVDKQGNVFHKGIEQPDLKGTLPLTKIKSRKKKRKLSADEKLFKLAKQYKKKKRK